MSYGGGAGQRGLERRRLLGATVSLGLVVVAALLAIVGGSDDSTTEPSVARIVSAGELEELQESLGHPLYWAGGREGESLEVKQETDGSVYLRYLPEGVEAGDPAQGYLTVGTYPVAGAQMALRQVAAESGAKLIRMANGALVLPNPSAPGSVYLAYPGGDLEIEVYDPESGRAMELVRSGAIEPVGG